MGLKLLLLRLLLRFSCLDPAVLGRNGLTYYPFNAFAPHLWRRAPAQSA
jgi:hypothetical protein